MSTRKVFKFYVDQEFTSWYRGHFEIEAKNEEEAYKIAIEALKNDDCEELVSVDGWDVIFGVETPTGVYELYAEKMTVDPIIASKKDDEITIHHNTNGQQ